MEAEADVLIVGGGLVGLGLACALKPSRLAVTLVDMHDAPVPAEITLPERQGHVLHGGFEARVSAINPASKDFLGRIGAWPDDTRVCTFTSMLVWDALGTARIEFDADAIGEAALGYVVENRNLLVRLAQSALSGEVDARFGTSIVAIERTTDGYRVELAGGDSIGCKLLVGADGGNSLVRQRCGMRSFGWSYGQDALVTTVMTAESHGTMARQCFTADGPLAFLPLAGAEQNLCSIVWSSARTEELLGLDDAGLCQRLSEASEAVLGEVLAVDKRYAFPLRQQHALSYVKPNLALIGDAAHVIHPLAGQGVNLGFADARALAMALGECRFSGQSPGDIALLKRYQRSRRPFNMVMSSAMEAFRRVYGLDQPAINWARNTGMRFVDSSHLMKSVVMKLACGR